MTGVLAASMLVFGVGTAAAHDAGSSTDGAIDHAKITHGHQHGATEGHLDPAVENVTLVSKLTLKNVVPEKIADVGVLKGYAYLAAWGSETCKYNGVHVVDIKNPAAPKEVAFIQAKEGSYPGEGVQAVSISTPAFTGDILVTNNEICKDKAGFGGMNIYNVSNPAHPTMLAEGVGDFTVNGQGKKAANEIHSVFAWDAGDKAYAVIVDNEEGPDVDIVDITNPRKAKVVAEYDLDAKFPQIVQSEPANLTEVFHHDVIVKQIGGKQVMSVSYWDGGYVLLDVTNPRDATYIADSDFPAVDPEILDATDQRRASEGNAHQSEFTRDNKYLIGADEDFSPNFAEATVAGRTFRSSQGGSSAPLGDGGVIADARTYFVGRSCTGDATIPPRPPLEGGIQIAVATRGVCTFQEKVDNVAAAGGYEAAVVVNRVGSDGCDLFGMALHSSIPSFALSREEGYNLFDLDGYDRGTCLGGDPAVLAGSVLPGVAIGTQGKDITLKAFFDGWGYVRLFRAGADATANTPVNGKLTLTELDRYVIPEAVNPAPKYTSQSGDLSVHEVATSQVQDDLAYLSYYSAGLRVVKIVNGELVEVGKYIGDGGNNFWGVELFTHNNQEYVAASDRDNGLWIFKYTPPTPAP